MLRRDIPRRIFFGTSISGVTRLLIARCWQFSGKCYYFNQFLPFVKLCAENFCRFVCMTECPVGNT